MCEPRPVLVAVAHGSRDSRSAAAMTALLAGAAALAPEMDTRLSFLDFNAPRLPDVLHAAAADGHTRAVVVPLLLTSAFHARTDVPAAVDAAARRLPRLSISVADVLGSRPDLLLDALDERLRDAGADPADPRLGVVIAGAGSSGRAANRAVSDLATRRPLTSVAFATGAGPGTGETVDRLRAAGAARIAVAPWFLAPGRLLDRIRRAARDADPGVLLAEPLGDHPRVARALLGCYREVALHEAALRDMAPIAAGRAG